MEREREAEREDTTALTFGRRETTVPPASPPVRRNWTFVATAVAAGLLAAGAAAWLLQAPASGDQDLTSAERQARVQAYLGEGRLQLPAVAESDVARALDAMQLAAGDRDALEQDLNAGRVKLAWLTVWDDMAEDGDVVRLDGGGFSRTIGITHVAQSVAVPLAADETFRLTGVYDGGGGITVAAKANGRDVLLPVIDQGQAVDVNMGL